MKSILRSYFLSVRKNLPQPVKLTASKEAISRFMHHPLCEDAQHIGLYHPIHDEIDITSMLSLTKSFYLPRVEGNDLAFYPYKDEMSLKKSSLGILEPTILKRIDHPLDVLIIPALAIDKNGYRLGYGKGFFDRYLARQRPKKVMAIIYDFQYVEQLPHETHDERVDEVIIISSNVLPE